MAVSSQPLPVFIAVLLYITASVSASGRLELKLQRYYNKYGLDKTKDHCDSFLYLFRTSKCDFYFSISIDGKDTTGNGPSWGPVKTQVYHNMNTVEFKSSLSRSEPNPIVRRFKSWMGFANINVKVVDEDNVSAHDDVDDINISLKNVKADGIERPHQHEGLIHHGDSHFRFTLRVTCDPNYFGSHCTRRCIPMNDPVHGHYRCTSSGEKKCLPHFKNSTGGCLDPTPCSPNPCLHAGRCQPSKTSYTCRCPRGYSGPHCETRIHPCEQHDHCKNGGKCVDVGWTNSTCRCQPSWTGRFCERDANECSELHSPCHNNATCVNTRGGFRCLCPKGFEGKTCSEDIDECLHSPCRNNGTCENSIGSYTCVCPAEFNATAACDAVAVGVIKKGRPLKQGVAVLIILICLIVCTICVVALIIVRRKRIAVIVKRVHRRRNHDDDDRCVIMSNDYNAPRLEFKNCVYDFAEAQSVNRSASDGGRSNAAFETDGSGRVRTVADEEDGYLQETTESNNEDEERKLRALFENQSDFPPPQDNPNSSVA